MAPKPTGIDVRRSARTGRVTYRIRWRAPGSDAQLSHTFADRRQAIDALRSIELAGFQCFCDRHCPVDTEPGEYGVRERVELTWGTYARRHITHRPGIGDHYRAQFTGELDRRMGPLLGLTFEQLNRDRVAEWIRSLEQAGLSATTIHRLVVQAGSVQRAAVDAGLAVGNPFAKQRTGRRDRDVRQTMRCLSQAEWIRLRGALPEGVYRDLCIVLIGTGLRFGEATALAVGAVDFDARPPRLHVGRAWKSDGNNGWLVGPPKSRRSRRTVTFGTSVAEALGRQVAGKGDDELVFVTPDGTPIRNSNFAYRIWKPAVRAAGLAGLRIHDLRHTHASWLIAAGRPTAAVSRRLGHESIATTDAIYTHILPKVDEDDVATLDAAMPPDEGPTASTEEPPGESPESPAG